MEQFVIKRIGEYEIFKPYKIEDALKKGFQSVAALYPTHLLEKILTRLAPKPLGQ